MFKRFVAKGRLGGLLLVGVVACTVSSGVLVAQEAEEEELGEALSFSAGFDLASAYYYRGIPQEDQGLITQPWAELGINLFSAEGEEDPLQKIDLAVGTWNSLHDNTPGDQWYESDFYASLSAELAAGVAVSVGYTYLYSPAAGDVFSEEVSVGLGLDTSSYLSDVKTEKVTGFKIDPAVNFVFEVQAGSDGLGADGPEGTMVEISLTPGFSFEAAKDYTIDVEVPITLGLNIEDYYETASGEDDDDDFGYLDIPVQVSLPLSFIPKRYGAWSFGGGIHFLILGDSASEIGETDFGVSDGDDFEIYTNWGLSMEI